MKNRLFLHGSKRPANTHRWEKWGIGFHLDLWMDSLTPVSKSVSQKQRWQFGCKSSWLYQMGAGGWSR